MNTPYPLGLGRWQRLLLETVLSSASFPIGDVIAQYDDWNTRSSIYRAARRMNHPKLAAAHVRYEGGIIYSERDDPTGLSRQGRRSESPATSAWVTHVSQEE